jgi:hypothetical protein
MFIVNSFCVLLLNVFHSIIVQFYNLQRTSLRHHIYVLIS